MPRKKRLDSKGIVYLISFPNKKKYIGITTTSFKERKQSHISHRNSSNLPVHNALAKHKDRVTWEIIDKGDNWNELKKMEIKYIKKYKSHISENGYNLTIGGDGTVGYKHSDESKLRNSERRKEHFKDAKNRKKQSKAGIIAHHENPKLAKEHSRFQTKRFKDQGERDRVAEGMRKYLSKKENLERHSRVRGGKEFFVMDTEGNVIAEYLIQAECAREMNLQHSKINLCLKGKRKTHGGYIFKYKE